MIKASEDMDIALFGRKLFLNLLYQNRMSELMRLNGEFLFWSGFYSEYLCLSEQSSSVSVGFFFNTTIKTHS